jgi:uncharacterized small protein (DUF1192 family)
MAKKREGYVKIGTLHTKEEVESCIKELEGKPGWEYRTGQHGQDVYRYIAQTISRKVYKDGEWEKICQGGKKALTLSAGNAVRLTAVIAAHIDMEYPGIQPPSEEEASAWEQDTMLFVRERFTASIPCSGVYEENGRPHISVLFVPVKENADGNTRLCFRPDFVDGPVSLQMIQKGYENATGFTRFGEKKRSHAITEHEKAARAEAMGTKSLPIPEDSQTAEQYREDVAEPVYTELQNAYHQLLAESSVDRGAMKELSELRTKMAVLEKELADTKTELIRERQRAAQNALYRVYETTGMELHPDQDMIQNLYVPLQQALIQAGKEERQRQRKDMETAGLTKTE